MRIKKYYILLIIVYFFSAKQYVVAQAKRIITLSSAISETVNALGYGKNILATDVTSVWPEEINRLPKVSRNRSFSVESIAAYRPDLILVPEGDFSKENLYQFKSLGIRVVAIRQEFSVQGATKFIRQIAAAIGDKARGEQLVQKTVSNINTTLSQLKKGNKSPKVLFIYARGVGTMNVAGKGSSIDEIIKLAGGKNAIQEFSDFKPYTTEALIKSNPDVILMFDFGLSSLGGRTAFLDLPGVSYTNAGKNKKIVEMNGPLLINFSNRLPEAIKALNNRIL
ncbi:heme/hemin ABC transporter substrate-binding protein [Pedobacter alluvionis]|uniref:Hemin ABC transporter substrate-binding protein n=1 Tax=Pedobacter alluvionis TaxID=475253 RepID=A0A497XY65_9SPHI|nr:ABC transporter substrate-binding protein [Pedobacter alluvionis]RLJ75061.1 iron complex transport system substrate-binding protein [Pedobacter alluvionis]TFB30171.1 hemin ABC transporter substrate-binding protein [Pedobacter alluvionis]